MNELLTDDFYELDILKADNLEQIEPDDPHFQEVCRIQYELVALNKALPPKRQFVAMMLMSGKNRKQIAEAKECSAQTVGVALADERVQRQLVLLQRLNHIRSGPAQDARQALLWRIAMREEEKRPSISIRAVDVMNRADGVYQPEAEEGAGGLTIRINNFTLNSPGEPQTPRDMTPKKEGAVLEGEFTPLTVEVTQNA